MIIVCLIILIIGFYLVKSLPQYRDAITFITLALIIITCQKNRIENMEIDQLSLEAIKNVSSVYNGQTLRVQNLEVTGGAKIGRINIRNDRVGMDGSVDLLFNGENIILHPYNLANKRTNLIVGKINSDNTVDVSGNITTTNKLISKEASIGKFDIRDDRIGHKDTHDLHFSGCLDVKKYGSHEYACIHNKGLFNDGDYTGLNRSITIVDYGRADKVSKAANAGFRNVVDNGVINDWGTNDLNRGSGGWSIDLRTK